MSLKQIKTTNTEDKFDLEDALIRREKHLCEELPKRNLSEFWGKTLPNYTPRKTQIDVMQWINELPADIKYVMCEIPVGGGKSPLALVYSAYLQGHLGSSLIFTPQKTLQKQYEDSFDPKLVFSVYGKTNYECLKKGTNCDIGSDIKPACDKCPAKEAFLRVNEHPNVVLNYKLGLTYYKYLSSRIKRRDLIVFDECHTMENHLVEFSSITISKKRCKKYDVPYKMPSSLDGALDWIANKYKPALKQKITHLSSLVKGLEKKGEEQLTMVEHQAVSDYKRAIDHSSELSHLLAMTPEQIDKKFVLVIDKGYFKFKELYGSNNFKYLLSDKANRFLFMSSTILDKDQFCQDLGIDPAHTAFISVDSEFKVENRPVYYKPVAKMTYGWDDPSRSHERKVMLSAIEHICDFHKDESGIIHTGSFKIAEWLHGNLFGKVPHKIYHHLPESGITRDVAIEKFLLDSEKRPSLLISPSVSEGMDLIGDKGRFAVIAKVPYPYLGDAWVKKRMNISKDWYNRQAITGIIQGCGRIVRSKEDTGIVYILDESFTYLYNQTKKMIPRWWKDALIVL